MGDLIQGDEKWSDLILYPRNFWRSLMNFWKGHLLKINQTYPKVTFYQNCQDCFCVLFFILIFSLTFIFSLFAAMKKAWCWPWKIANRTAWVRRLASWNVAHATSRNQWLLCRLVVNIAVGATTLTLLNCRGCLGATGRRKGLEQMAAMISEFSGQFITTSAEVTPNGGLVRESPPK